jgi:hypothetical protein
MAVLKAPLMSFSASGQIGKSVVFATWKGQKYARQYIIPTNPKTAAQIAQRNLFKWVHDWYKFAATDVTQAWVTFAKGKMITGANAWSSKNMTALHGASVITNIIYIPAVLGGPPNQGITITPGATQLTILGVPPPVPTGWTIAEMIAVTCKQQIPSGEEEPNPSFTMTKSASPWSVVQTGLTSAQAYVCGVGWKYTKPDLSTAYGGSTNAIGTPT